MFMGMIRLFQMPTAQSLIADTLPAERVGSGAAFNTIAMNIAMLTGPVVGGLLFKAYGAGRFLHGHRIAVPVERRCGIGDPDNPTARQSTP